MEDGKISYAVIDTTCLLKLKGAIVYSISPCFDKFLEKIASRSDIESFVVDLTETSYIDSTNLGLLAKLRIICSEQCTVPPTLISNKENVNEVLYNVGFSRIFNIVEQVETDYLHLENIPNFEGSAENLAKIMFKAHTELVKLNENNKELFEDVVEYLEKDARGCTPF